MFWGKFRKFALRFMNVHGFFFFNLCFGTLGTAATINPGWWVMLIVEKLVECRLAGKTEVLGQNLPQRHFVSTTNPTLLDTGLNPCRRGGKPATNRLSYGAA
jgi:hypothetical protein